MLWVAIGQIVAASAAIAGVKILTSLLSISAYGELALATTIVGGINMFVFGPFSQAVMRFYSIAAERGHTNAYFGVVCRLAMQACLLLFIATVLAGLAVRLLLGSGFWLSWLIAAAAFGLTAGLLSVPLAIFAAMRDRRAVVLLQGGDPWLRVLLALLLVTSIGADSRLVVVGYALGSLTMFGAALAMIGTRFPARIKSIWPDSPKDHKLHKELIAYGLPFVGFAAFASISQFSDRWILQNALGADDVGMYAVLQQIAVLPPTILYGVMSNFFVPIVFARVGDDADGRRLSAARRIIGLASLLYIATILFGALIIAVWGDQLVALLSTNAYSGQTTTLLVLYFAAAIFMLGQFLALIGLAKNRPADLLWPKGIQAALALGLGVVLASIWGVHGVAWAGLIAAAVYMAIIGLVAARSRGTDSLNARP